jgi:magnesium-transporting ATPase (P-type)
LKGANLKNTSYCIAFCAFTGKDTRVMLNSLQSKSKLSKVAKFINVFVMWIVIFETILCLSLGLMASFWSVQGTIDTNFYIPFEFALHYFLLLSTFVPISLFVTLEIMKMTQSMQVGWDY